MLTLIELFERLGNQAAILTDDREPIENRRRTAEMALTTSLVAKQMINIADIAIRAEKMTADKKLDNSAVMQLISGNYGLVIGTGNDGEFAGHGE